MHNLVRYAVVFASGEVGGQFGVKLEQPVWLHAEGATLLAEYPLDTDYL